MTLGSSFALTHDLRRFQVSIDPKHTPELFMRESNTYHHYSLPLSPSPSSRTTSLPAENLATSVPLSPPLTASRSPSNSGRSPASPKTPSSVVDSLPTTREWRRFTKKAMRLHSIEWGGRGGMGVWTFEKGGGTKVDFEPVGHRGLSHKILERRESDEIEAEGHSNGRRSSSGNIGASGSWGRRKARRMSEVSLVGSCLEGLDFGILGIKRSEDHAKESPSLGLGSKHAHHEGNGNGSSTAWHGGNGYGRRHSSAGTSSSTTTSPCTSPRIPNRSLHHKQSLPVASQPQAIPSSKFSAPKSPAPSMTTATSPPSLGANSSKSFVSVAATSPENWQVPIVLHSTSPPHIPSLIGTKGTPFVVGATAHNPTTGTGMNRGSSSGSQSTSAAEIRAEVSGDEDFIPVQGRKVVGKNVSGKVVGGKK